MMYGFLATGFLFSTVVVILVLLNTPSSTSKNKDGNGVHFFKTFIVSYIVCTAIAYVIQEPDTNNMMNNILKHEPDF